MFYNLGIATKCGKIRGCTMGERNQKEKEKGELLIEINSILEVLPVCECQEIKDFILGVYIN